MDRNEQLASDAQAILAAAAEQNIPARLLGGLAVYMKCESTRQPPFARAIADMDFIVNKRRSADFGKLLSSMGYTGDHQFNSIHGATRLLFTSDRNDVDVFVGAFQQCHELDLESVINQVPTTIPLAQLLLTKLQIVQINRKDELDTLAIINDHELVAGGTADDIDLDVIKSVTGADWGWYTTVGDTLVKLDTEIDDSFTGEQAAELHRRVAVLRDAIQSAPKSMKWKMRDKIGRRVPWYDLPEEKKL